MAQRGWSILGGVVLLFSACHEQPKPEHAAPPRQTCPPHPDPDICPAEPLASVTVTAVDARTGEKLCGFNPLAIDDNGHEVHLQHYARPGTEPCAFFMNEEREGTFTISAHKRGYEPQTRPVVQCNVDGCYFSGDDVRFVLVPAANAAEPSR